jgi:hypothetical protein
MGIVRIRESSSALLSSARSLPDPMPVAGLLITPPIVQTGLLMMSCARMSPLLGIS